jgi:hypothetical protein
MMGFQKLAGDESRNGAGRTISGSRGMTAGAGLATLGTTEVADALGKI